MDLRNQDSASSAASDAKGQNYIESDPQRSHEHDERNHSVAGSQSHNPMSAAEKARRNVNAKLANPLAGISHAALENMGAMYARKHQIGDEEDIRAFQKGACLAQDPTKYASVEGLTEQELEVLKKEFTNRWSQPRLLYLVIILCSTCAAVQGMGEYSIRNHLNYQTC